MKTVKIFGLPLRAALVVVLASIAIGVQAMGVDLHPFFAQHAVTLTGLSGLMFIGEVDGAAILKALDSVEKKMAEMSDKATSELKDIGKVSTDTKAALENIGIEQRTLADRMLQLEQKATEQADAPADLSVGAQFIKNDGYQSFLKADGRLKTRIETKNTVTNVIANTFSERRPGIVEGAFRVFTIEDLLTTIPTASSAIEWIQETVFTNGAAETAEGTTKPQSSLTFTPKITPVSTVAHWIKITRQLAMDNAALAAYINRRMVYGVNFRVESQLVAGNGVAPNLVGLTAVGSFTAHGYTAALLTAAGLDPANRFDLIGKMIGDCALADYPADVVLMNTGDWWTMRLTKDKQGRYLLGDPGSNVVPTLFGRPVVASNAMLVGKVWVGSLAQAATLHNREGVVVDLSDSDGDNFINNLITIRAERRVALTVEKPAAARYGDLVPA